jgi:hypothetical protein
MSKRKARRIVGGNFLVERASLPPLLKLLRTRARPMGCGGER